MIELAGAILLIVGVFFATKWVVLRLIDLIP